MRISCLLAASLISLACHAQTEGVAATPPETVPAPSLSCAQLTTRATAADLKAANAQSGKQSAAQIAALLDTSIGTWTQASQVCEGRAKERALRNLNDSQRTRDGLQTQLGADPECTTGAKDATQLQELAQQAMRERRWLDASMLYRKAENMWDLTAEHCTGDLHSQAEQKRAQTAQDAHNAEHCAPLFERAREQTQQFRRLSASVTALDKQAHSQAAETLWREAERQCQGSARSLASTNAQNLAKERGTPWVATPVPTSPMARQTAVGAPRGTAGTAGTAATASAALSAATASASPTDAPATAATPAQPTEMEVRAGDALLKGKFVKHGTFLSGHGTVTWGNGDTYTGDLKDSQPHGQGDFVWANGNRYTGELANGVPQGRGRMRYASGDMFEGTFQQGEPSGNGLYRWASGQTYQGPWKAGGPNGQGELKFANGNFYKGALVAGLPKGRGKLVFVSGDEYEGQFDAGQPQGEGEYRWKNGDRYSGQWRQGMKHGHGKMQWSNGDVWEGRFERDQQTEEGSLTRKNP